MRRRRSRRPSACAPTLRPDAAAVAAQRALVHAGKHRASTRRPTAIDARLLAWPGVTRCSRARDIGSPSSGAEVQHEIRRHWRYRFDRQQGGRATARPGP
ncbi:hypothetical protein [Lysobacter gummosus]|uniref:hypothetical protein n=1 Tax=Lysobacter gummosus TaxID=262324 RepID=UPI003632903F